MAKRLLGTLLIALPVLTAALWLASGRETLTKSARTVPVQVKKPLFGDTFTREETVPGPILGYYVGLDLVIVLAAACVVIGGVAWWAFHRHVRLRTQRRQS
jgi:hypothetical protein